MLICPFSCQLSLFGKKVTERGRSEGLEKSEEEWLRWTGNISAAETGSDVTAVLICIYGDSWKSDWAVMKSGESVKSKVKLHESRIHRNKQENMSFTLPIKSKVSSSSTMSSQSRSKTNWSIQTHIHKLSLYYKIKSS